MLPWIELQQIKAYWLQYHVISHTQLHLVFFLIKVKKKYYFNNMKITLDHLVYCLCKGLHFPPSWLIPVFENSFPTSHLLYSGFLSLATMNTSLSNAFQPKWQPCLVTVVFWAYWSFMKSCPVWLLKLTLGAFPH